MNNNSIAEHREAHANLLRAMALQARYLEQLERESRGEVISSAERITSFQAYREVLEAGAAVLRTTPAPPEDQQGDEDEEDNDEDKDEKKKKKK